MRVESGRDLDVIYHALWQVKYLAQDVLARARTDREALDWMDALSQIQAGLDSWKKIAGNTNPWT